jgi:uncharacterized protein YsxB (DUF464 family)
MVEVTFERDSRERLSSVFARGHAESGEYPHDLVCAAVSAVLQAAYAGLQEVARLRFEGTRRRGNLRIKIPARSRGRADVAAIVATAEVALLQLARQYPKFVRVTRTLES